MITLSNGALIFVSGKCVNIRDIVGYKLGKKCRYSQEMCIIILNSNSMNS